MIFRTGGQFPTDVLGRLMFIQISTAHGNIKEKSSLSVNKKRQGNRRYGGRATQSTSSNSKAMTHPSTDSEDRPTLSPSLFAQYDLAFTEPEFFTPTHGQTSFMREDMEGDSSLDDSDKGDDDGSSDANSDVVALKSVKQSPIFSLNSSEIQDMSSDELVGMTQDNPGMQLVQRLIDASLQASIQPTLHALQTQLSATSNALQTQQEINEDLTSKLNEMSITSSTTAKSIEDIRTSVADSSLRTLARDYRQVKNDYEAAMDIINLYVSPDGMSSQEQRELALARAKSQRLHVTMQNMVIHLQQECQRYSVSINHYIPAEDVDHFLTQTHE